MKKKNWTAGYFSKFQNYIYYCLDYPNVKFIFFKYGLETNCISNWDGSIGIAHIDERCPLLFIQLRYMDMASNVTL